MAKRHTPIFIVAGLIVLGVIALLLVTSLGGDDDADVPDRDPARHATSETEAPAAAPGRPASARPGPDPRSTGDPQAPPVAEEPAVAAEAVDAGLPLEVKRQQFELRGAARKQQIDMHRQQLKGLRARAAQLSATIERLKSDGASQQQLDQIQTRVQQMLDAEPRMKKRLQELEAEQAVVDKRRAAVEARKKSRSEAATGEAAESKTPAP